MENILYPATKYEKKQCDLNLVKDNDAKPISDNFKDIYGQYYSLGDRITRTSADTEIDKAHTERKREYKRNALKCHPDKNQGKEEETRPMWKNVLTAFGKAEASYETFKALGGFGLSGRYYYDRKCDGVRIYRKI